MNLTKTEHKKLIEKIKWISEEIEESEIIIDQIVDFIGDNSWGKYPNKFVDEAESDLSFHKMKLRINKEELVENEAKLKDCHIISDDQIAFDL